jgi:hypothetical protein
MECAAGTQLSSSKHELGVHCSVALTLVAVVIISELSVLVLAAPFMFDVHAAVPVISSRPAATT